MSYEGFTQRICETGHYLTLDCNEWGDDHDTCPYCNKPWAWTNMVNTTNGSFDDDDKRIDGYVELTVISPTVYRPKGTLAWFTLKDLDIQQAIYEIPPKKKRLTLPEEESGDG